MTALNTANGDIKPKGAPFPGMSAVTRQRPSGARARLMAQRFACALSLACGGLAWAADRVALVIGNSAYRSSPLYNPENDARDMSKLLRQAGFQVIARTNTSRDDMQRAIAEFGKQITSPQVKIAVFYYAGHGVQLDWRNYLIPVDAAPRTPEELKTQSLDVSALLTYMQRAQQKDRSFLVVLDACRDDPFAGTYKPDQKGLSQFDAPVGSLLAYATAPGRVAIDGTSGGTNGLYTAYLLQELAKRGAPIEDAFKRTRLNVRLASNGQQVPWESTSLEEDVYLFPGERKKPSDRDQMTQLDSELGDWNKVKASGDPFALAEFLRTHPSGNFSELAANRMNLLLGSQSNAESVRLVAKNLAVVEAKKAQEERDKAEAERVKRESEARLAAEAARAAMALAAQQAREVELARRAEEQAVAAAQEARKQELARAEAARQEVERERLAQLALAAAQAAKAEAERIATFQRTALAAAAQLAQETAAAMRAAAQREAERQATARLAAERAAAEKAEAARAEALRVAEAARIAAAEEVARNTAARLAAEKAAAQQAEAQRLELQRLAEARRVAEEAEKARIAAAEAELARAQSQRLAQAQAEQQRGEAARAQAAKLAADRAEADRLARAAAQAAADKLAAEAQAALSVAQTAVAGLTQAVKLAQERVQAADAAPAPAQAVLASTPFFAGSNQLQRSYTVGDRYEFKVVDLFNRSERPLVMQVSSIDVNADRIEFNGGEYVSDTMGNILTNLRGSSATPRQFYPAELFVGKRWRTMFRQVRPNGLTYTFRYDMRVVGRERVTVPAGTFDTFKIEGRGFNMTLGAALERNIWVSPGVAADIALETQVRLANGMWDQRERQELVGLQQQAPRTPAQSASLNSNPGSK